MKVSRTGLGKTAITQARLTRAIITDLLGFLAFIPQLRGQSRAMDMLGAGVPQYLPGDQSRPRMINHEEIETRRGERVKRVKSSFIYLCGFASLVVGIILVLNDKTYGGFLSLTAFPILILYPLVRALFGGKDSVVSVVTTAIIEEVLKDKITSSMKKKRRS